MATSPSGNAATVFSFPPTASLQDRRLHWYTSAGCPSLDTAGWFRREVPKDRHGAESRTHMGAGDISGPSELPLRLVWGRM